MSLRSNGSYIGYNRVTTTSQDSASGIWSLAAAERRRRAAAWPMPFLPSNVTGLQLWLDASDATTLYDATSGGSLVAADGSVARWEDKSGNARHATQSTSGSRPLRKTGVQGGKDVLRFDGSNDSLSIPTSTATFKFLHTSDHTVFIVFENENASYDPLVCTNSGGTDSVGLNIYAGDAGAGIGALAHQVFRGVNGTSVINSASAQSFLTVGWNVVSVVGKPTDGTAANRSSIRKNGGSAVTNNAATGATSANDPHSDLLIGRDGPPFDYHGGDIAEIIIYDSALSDANREAVENYLLAKWGI